MLPIALFSWWYTTAWRGIAHSTDRRFHGALNFFSVGLLLRTLFDPYRQIAAVRGKGSLDAQLRAWADRSFSRMVGAVLRSIFIFTGLLAASCIVIIGFFQMLLWPLVPALPLIALTGMVLGWSL
jgi:hypothetical protein